jgi:hypothetical protein
MAGPVHPVIRQARARGRVQARRHGGLTAGQQFRQPELAHVHVPGHGHHHAGEARGHQPEEGGDHRVPHAGGYGSNHGVS